MFRIEVDCGRSLGYFPPLSHAVMGNAGYNLLRAGVRLQRVLEGICEEPLWRRVMDTLGTGIGIDKSPGVYGEDESGRPFYDFTFFDQIIDVIATPRCVPFMGIGFMPNSLSAAAPAVKSEDGSLPPEAGPQRPKLTEPWMRIDRFPPKDYDRWFDLVFAMVSHCVERYGAENVSGWRWEFWNEPDLRFYWLGGAEEFFKTYDYAAAAVRKALPNAIIGGPGTAGGGKPSLFREFLEHCVSGKNACTGEKGAPLDFITFHMKGGSTGSKGIFHDPWNATNYERKHPSLENIIRNTTYAMEVIGSIDGLEGLPVFLTECDIDWGTGTSIYNNPNMHYRNSEYFAAFQAALVCRMLEARDRFPDNPIERLFMDTFYFPGFRVFEGQRTLITGECIDKPILNCLRLLGRLGDERLPVSCEEGHPVRAVATARNLPKGGRGLRVMAVNFEEDFDSKNAISLAINLNGIDEREWKVCHYRIDRDHSNAYTLWLDMGRPVAPDDGRLAALQSRMGLEECEAARVVSAQDNRMVLKAEMPPHSVSLWTLDPVG